MSSHDSVPPAMPELDDGALSLYLWTVKNGRLSEQNRQAAMTETGLGEQDWQPTLTALASAQLLRPAVSATSPGESSEDWTAVSPQAAGAQLLAAQEARLHSQESALRDQRDQIHRLRDYFSSLMPVYLEGRDHAHPEAAVDMLADKHAVRAVLTEAIQNCRSEVLISKPGAAFPLRSLQEALPRDLELLRRGIRMRSLYQHTTRFDLHTRHHAEQLVDAGAEIRTLPEVLPQMIIVDRQLAFLPACPQTHGALLAREPSLIAFLLDVFERDWVNAAPFNTGPQAAHETSQTLKQSILVLLAKGLKDESVARRLGISLRTCRRHVSELLETLGAQSRFQAGATAERLGLTTYPDCPDEAP